jgi:alpha-glucosidase
LPANYPPKSVRVDGKEFKYARYAEVGEWGYDGYTLAPYIVVGEVDNAKGCVVEIEFAEGDLAAQHKLYGMQGIVNRCVALTAELKEVYGKYYDPYPLLPDFYMNVSQAPNFIMEFPQDIHKSVENYYKSLAECLVEVEKMDKFPIEYRARVKALLTKQ